MSLLKTARKIAGILKTPEIWDPAISPEVLYDLRKLWRIVSQDLGAARSMAERQCLDSKGQPYPWLTYPAIEFLESLDLSEASVFEFGAGASTLWWAKRVKRVVAAETDPEWNVRVTKLAPGNVTVFLESDPKLNAQSILKHGKFDVILVDGIVPRFEHSASAVQCLNPGGMIVLDNSDWLPRSCAIMREAGLIQVDFCGLSPLNCYGSATTVFLSRDFAFRRRGEPAAISGVVQDWETGVN